MRIALEPIVSVRRRAVLRTTLRAASERGVPPDAIDLIRRVVEQARLWPRECEDVASELIAHFEDGRDAGVPDAELVRHFGNASLTARLIGSAKRRQRPATWHALRHTVTAVVAVAGLALLVYLGSAASLYLTAPAQSSRDTATLAETVARSRATWSLTTSHTEHRMAAANSILAGADASDGDHFIDEMMRLFAMADTLRDERSVAGDMMAGLIEAEAATAVHDAVTAGAIPASHPDMARLVDAMDRQVTLDGVRVSFRELLDDMYTRDDGDHGHLTGAGIDLLRELKDWGGQSRQDKLLEPAWYAFPASRRDVVEWFDHLCELAEGAGHRHRGVRGVQDAMKPLSESLVKCLRYPGISVVHHQLLNVLVATERSSQARGVALAAIDERRHAGDTGSRP